MCFSKIDLHICFFLFVLIVIAYFSAKEKYEHIVNKKFKKIKSGYYSFKINLKLVNCDFNYEFLKKRDFYEKIYFGCSGCCYAL